MTEIESEFTIQKKPEVWSQEYLHPSSLFERWEWIQSVSETYKFPAFYLLHKSSQASFPFFRFETPIGPKISVLPFSDYTSLGSSGDYSLLKMIAFFKLHFPDHAITIKTATLLHAGELIKEGFIPMESVGHSVKLTNDSTRSYASSFHRGIKKANRYNLKVEWCRQIHELEPFYEMFCQQRLTKFKTIPQPFGFFQNIHRNLISNGNGFLLKATYKSQSVAYLFVLTHLDTLYYKFGCSNPKYLYLRPNNLLFHYLIEYGKKYRFKKLDLGLSGLLDKGLIRFKEAMGGKAFPIINYNYYPSTAYQERQEKQLESVHHEIASIVGTPLPPKAISKLSAAIYPHFA